MISLRIESEPTPARFAEIGCPRAGFRDTDGQLVALVSEFSHLYWPARGIYEGHRLRFRLSLYSGDPKRRVAVFDEARHPINDVAFHPSRPIVAVGTGSYDGGSLFEGQLFLWNWRTGECRSLLGESRDVARCRFVDEDRLVVLLRPRTDEEFEGTGDRAFDPYVGCEIHSLSDIHDLGGPPGTDPRLADLTPILPSALGFDGPDLHHRKRRPTFFEALGDSPDFRERARVWDTAWLSDDAIAIVHDNCHLEVWGVDGECRFRSMGHGHGIQLFPTESSLLVHVFRRGDSTAGTRDGSGLWVYENRRFSKIREFDRPVVLSSSRDGRLLCRDPGVLHRPHQRLDRVSTGTGEQLLSTDLGHYDCFNHYLRLDGGDGLYFLRGTPASSHQGKVLCRLDGMGAIEEVVGWDPPDGHLMCSSACWGPDGSLIRAFRVHHPRPGQGQKRIERVDLGSGETLWTRTLDALVTAMTPMANEDHLAYTLTNGQIGVLAMSDGEVEFEADLAVEGIPTFGMSLAARGSRLAVGTIDGRLIVFRLDRG